MDEPSPPQHTLPHPPETTFDTREDLVNYVRSWAKAQGYPVSIHKSDKVKVTFICIKGGPVRKRVDDNIRQRKRSSRKIGCMFKATARKSNKDDKWHLTITNASHNHSAEQNEPGDVGGPGSHEDPGSVDMADATAGDTLMGGTADLGLLDGDGGLNSPSTLEVVMRYPSSDLASRVMTLEASKRAEENTIRELRQQNRLLSEQNNLFKQQLELLKQQTEIMSRTPDLSSFVALLAPAGIRVLLEYYLATKFIYDGSQRVLDFVSGDVNGQRLPQIALDLEVGLEKCHQLFVSNFPYNHEDIHETTLHNIIAAIRLSDDTDVLHQVFRRCFGENPTYFSSQDHLVRSLPHPEFSPVHTRNVLNKQQHHALQQQQQQQQVQQQVQQVQVQQQVGGVGVGHYGSAFGRGMPHPALASHRMGHPHAVRMGN